MRTLAFADAGLTVRADDGDGRTVIGLAVPFDVTVDTPDIGPERFRRGAFARTISHGSLKRIKLCVSHNRANPVGVCTALEERDRGLFGAWRVSDTVAGDDVLAQVRDGTFDELSIGFEPLNGRRLAGAFEHSEVRLREVSLVPWGTYGDVGAKVLAVREDTPPAGTPRLDGLRDVLSRLTR